MDAPDFLHRIDVRYVVGVFGAGWLLAFCCLVDKHRKKREGKTGGSKESHWHLVNGVVKLTFTSVTMVAVVHVTLNIAIYLPDVLDRVESGIGAVVREEGAATRDQGGKESEEAIAATNAARDALRLDLMSTLIDLLGELRAAVRESEEDRAAIEKALEELRKLLDRPTEPSFADEAYLSWLAGTLEEELPGLARRHLQGHGAWIVDSRLHFQLKGPGDFKSFTVWLENGQIKTAIHP